MTRENLEVEQLANVSGGSYSFNMNNGKVSIGNMDVSHVYQIKDPAKFAYVESQLRDIFNQPGSDAEKNAKAVQFILGGEWGTMIK